MTQVDAIHLYHPLLTQIALKWVGSIQDAEDIVQDTFEKWMKIDSSKINNTRAYLIKSVKNNCITFLQTWNKKAMQPQMDGQEVVEVHHQISEELYHKKLCFAMHLLQDKLQPAEKSLFLLREAFQVEYDVLQGLFNKRADNLRQKVARIKKKIHEETSRLKPDLSVFTIPDHFSFPTMHETLESVKKNFSKKIF